MLFAAFMVLFWSQKCFQISVVMILLLHRYEDKGTAFLQVNAY